jgi:hypothetical protein
MAFTGLAIAAALALAKNKLVDEPAAKKQRTLAAATQRLSPWTHLTANTPTDPNAIGDVLQYGATGASMGSNIAKQGAENDLLKAKTGMYNRMGAGQIAGASPWGQNSLNPNAIDT